MDKLQQTPSADLLSTQEAKERLGKIVEGFFFRRLRTQAGRRILRLLVKSPPSLGNTTQAVEYAIHYQAEQEARDAGRLMFVDLNAAGVPAQTAVFVPRHQFAVELREVIERAFGERGKPISVPILIGRGHGGEKGNAPCRRWREAGELARKGLPIYTNLCRRKSDGQLSQCPYFAGCEYIRMRQAAYYAPIVILVHSHLGLEWGALAAERFRPEEDDDDSARPPEQANILVWDHDPTDNLVEQVRLTPEDIRSLSEGGLGEMILAGLRHPVGLLDYFRDQGVSADQLRRAAESARMRERLRAQISSPGVGDDDLARAVNSAPRLVRRSRMLERLADELASGRPGPAYSLLADGDRLIAQGRRTLVFNDQRLLLLDETANPEILREFVRQLQDLPEIRVRRNARVIQVRDFTFYGHDLAELAPASEGWALWRPKARLAVVAEFIAGVARAGPTLVVTTKRVRCALTGEDSRASLPVSVPYTGADLAHFGNIRGTKEFEDHDTVIILGWEQPCVRDAEQRAMAIWYDTKEPIRSIVPDAKGRVQFPERMRPYRMRDGSRRRGRVNIHPDRRVQAVVEQVREAEIVQAIDRLRLIDSPQRKTVFILCNIPLSIPIDELVTWRELAGDGRLERALETCDENGWEALPLAAAELSRLFPELWGTETAAADWLGKNPPNPDTPLIRHWGVIGVYRRKRRSGRWSKALVRHGVDPMVALAAVLEVAGEDLQLRDPQMRIPTMSPGDSEIMSPGDTR